MDWGQLIVSAATALGGGGIGAKLVDLKRERQRQATSAEEAARRLLAERVAVVEARWLDTQERLDKAERDLFAAQLELTKTQMRLAHTEAELAEARKAIQGLERERNNYREGYERLKKELEKRNQAPEQPGASSFQEGENKP